MNVPHLLPCVYFSFLFFFFFGFTSALVFSVTALSCSCRPTQTCIKRQNRQTKTIHVALYLNSVLTPVYPSL